MATTTNKALAEHANKVLAEWSAYAPESARARMTCRIYGQCPGTRYWVQTQFEDRAKAKPFASDEEVDAWVDEQAALFQRGLKIVRAEAASPPALEAFSG
jgi:hypothetical protein